LKFCGVDIRSADVTNEVLDILRNSPSKFIQDKIFNRLKDLSAKDLIYRLPLEIGAASSAANGLTLFKSAQIGLVADLTKDFIDKRDANGLGIFTLNTRSA
jgi:hypothetical protein